MSFWGQCNVETASLSSIQGLFCSKVAGFEGGFISKTFQGLHFLFLGVSFGRYILSYLFACEINLTKKCSVRQCSQLCLGYQSLFELIVLSYFFSNLLNLFSRVLGKAILSDHYQIQNVPKRNSNYCKSSISEGSGSLGRSIGIPSASSVASDISVLSLGSETLKNEVSG